MEQEKSLEEPYHGAHITEQQVEEFLKTGKVTIVTRGMPCKPGEFLQLWTPDESTLRAKVLSTKRIDGISIETELGNVGD